MSRVKMPKRKGLSPAKLEKMAKRAHELAGGQYYCDPQWLVRFAALVSEHERAQCLEAVEAEKVDAAGTGEETDKAYNQAIDDAAGAIKRLAGTLNQELKESAT